MAGEHWSFALTDSLHAQLLLTDRIVSILCTHRLMMSSSWLVGWLELMVLLTQFRSYRTSKVKTIIL